MNMLRFPSAHFQSVMGHLEASSPRSPALVYVIIVLLALASNASAQDPTVSISSYTAYDVQRNCVKQCLVGPHNDGKPGVIRSLGCLSPQLDSCYCRTAMASEVSAGMTECINSYCGSKTADLSAALSLYDHYCAGDLTVVTKAATVSLASDEGMTVQRTCVQGCMMGLPADGGSNLMRALQCTATPGYNDCLCRPDLDADANKHLTACVNRWCSGNMEEISSAVSLYSSYCAAANEAAVTDGSDAGTNGSQTAPSAGGATTKNQPTKTGTGTDAGTTEGTNSGGSGDGTSSNPSNGLSTGAVAGIAVVGVVLGLGAGVGLWIFVRNRRSQTDPIELHNGSSEELKPVYPPPPPTLPRQGGPGLGMHNAGVPGMQAAQGDPGGAPGQLTQQNLRVNDWVDRHGQRSGTPSEFDVRTVITDPSSIGRW